MVKTNGKLSVKEIEDWLVKIDPSITTIPKDIKARFEYLQYLSEGKKPHKKGGKVKTSKYSKGGGVRTAKYKV